MTCNIEDRAARIEEETALIARLRETPIDEQMITYGFLLGLGAQLPQQQATEQ